MDMLSDSRTFLVGGPGIEHWDIERNSIITKFEWGTDTVIKLKSCPSEPHLVLCSSMDRGVFLHDLRLDSNLRKTTLINKSSALCWNPQEPINFTVGNEDSNLYGFDMRKLDKARKIYKGHIAAV